MVTDDQGDTASIGKTVTVEQTPADPPPSGGAINFNDYTLRGYGGSQYQGGVVQIEDGGATLYFYFVTLCLACAELCGYH